MSATAIAARVVFTSSLAVYGAPLPDLVGDTQHLTPLTSYGAQKAMGELLLADYSRRGFLDGLGLRLPTICVRPGKPNKAASGFFSGIIREPLAGREATLPVADDVCHGLRARALRSAFSPMPPASTRARWLRRDPSRFRAWRPRWVSRSPR